MTEEELTAILVALRDAQARGIRGTLAARLTTLAELLQAGEISADEFTRLFRGQLGGAYLRQVGTSQSDLDLVGQLLNRQDGYLAGFAQDLVAGTGTMPVAARAGLYAQTVYTASQAGVVASALTATRLVEWHLGADDENTCDPCREAADGGPYEPDALPGLPGVICDGGPNCRCELRPL